MQGCSYVDPENSIPIAESEKEIFLRKLELAELGLFQIIMSILSKFPLDLACSNHFYCHVTAESQRTQSERVTITKGGDEASSFA